MIVHVYILHNIDIIKYFINKPIYLESHRINGTQLELKLHYLE